VAVTLGAVAFARRFFHGVCECLVGIEGIRQGESVQPDAMGVRLREGNDAAP
jgi:hypothetical protein